MASSDIIPQCAFKYERQDLNDDIYIDGFTRRNILKKTTTKNKKAPRDIVCVWPQKAVGAALSWLLGQAVRVKQPFAYRSRFPVAFSKS